MKKKKSNKRITLSLFASLLAAIAILIFQFTSMITDQDSQTQSAQIVVPDTQTNTTDTKIEKPEVTQTSNISTNSALPQVKIPILMYHHVRDYNDPKDSIGTNLSVSPTNFAHQLDLIKNYGYSTVTFNDIRNNLLPAKSIVITFDDGYQNFYQSAYPELKKRGMTAVVFVIARDKNGMYLSDDQIREMAKNGIEIGSHTLSHPDLSKLSVAKAQNEIVSSKQELETITNESIRSFCYPSGKYNAQVIDIVKKAGYDLATTTNGGIGDFTTPFELRRFRVNSNTDINKYIK